MSGLLTSLLAVALGGACGAVARFGAQQLAATLFGRAFPWGTLGVNVLGSLVIGMLFVLLVQNEAVRREWESVAMVGFLGAFTTFSTFSLEMVFMLQAGRWVAAGTYALASLSCCVGGCALGMRLARTLV